MKYKKYLEARELRKSGHSVNEIVNLLNVSKGSVSIWVRDIKLNEIQRDRLKEKHLKSIQYGDDSSVRRKNLNLRKQYQDEGKSLAKKYINESLFIMGCSLYWAEGNKSRNMMGFSNSDPNMLKLFMRFLMTYFNANKEDFKVNLHTHKDNGKPINEIMKYWMEVLDLPEKAMMKPYVDIRQVSGSRGRKNTLHNGIIRINLYDTKLIQNLYGAIQELGDFNHVEWLG